MDYNYLWFILLIVNAAGFILTGIDKVKAKRGSWRIPEKRFLLLGFCGGALGVYIGMRLFRHKTQHLKFTYGVPLLIIWNFAVLYLILNNTGGI